MNKKRVGIVGVGNVGATLAFTLATKNICSSILLKDVRENIVQAMALDISQATNAAKSETIIHACLSDEEFKDCDVIVITAGIARRPGMSRDDLLLTNAKIMNSVINSVIPFNPNAIIIIVSNPLDVMVYTALKTSNWSRNKIIGMAGILDSARMAHFIFEKLGYGQGQIKASVMGGHGDDMVPLADFSTVNGVNLNEVLSKEDIEDIIYKTKNGGAQIVKLLETGSAYYAPAYSTILMIEAILEDKKEIYPCAIMLNGEYGYENIVSGVPVMLGANGVEKVVELELKEEQKNQFSKSIASVQELINILKEKK
ncbi:MAG: malate dehydrogenase [Aliarcobacter sp.]|nr:malate dehydrogenase [Aliarcobacter sp.]